MKINTITFLLVFYLVLSNYAFSNSKVQSSSKELKQIELTIQQKYIEVDYKSKLPKVTYSPGSDRRSSKYTHYIFSYDDFKEKLGDPEKVGSVKIIIEILSTKKKNYTPEKGMPSPDGGFTHIYHRSRIIKKLN